MVEPVTAVLSGLALARSSIAFIKENMDSLNDAAEIGRQLSNIFQGHQEFNKKRFSGGFNDVAIEMIEYKQQQEALYELQLLLDFRFGNGFYSQIQQEYQRRLKEQKEQERLDKIRRRKKVEKVLMGSLLMAAFGVFGVIMFVIILQIRG